MKNYVRNPQGARPISDYVSVRAAVTTSEQITVPAGATMVLLSSALGFYVAFGSNPTAAVPGADLDDGTSNEYVNPATPDESRLFNVTAGSKIAVAAASATVITAAFFSQ